MAGYLNKAMIIGNLGRDPEMRYTQSGQAVTNFSVATSRRWTGQDGEQREDNRLAPHRRVGQVGRDLQRIPEQRDARSTSRVASKRGSTRTVRVSRDTLTEIVALEMQMLGSRPQSDGGGNGGGGGDDLGGEPIDVDDMPF